MKYIKSFNEAGFRRPSHSNVVRNRDTSTLIDEVKELCNNYLTYLYDSGFKISVREEFFKTIGKRFFKVAISKNKFTLSDISDEIIQFVEYLNTKEYKLSNDIVKFAGIKTGFIDIDDIINDSDRYKKIYDIELSDVYLLISCTTKV